MKNYHTIYIRRCRKVQKINSLRIRVHRYCELTYDTDDSCSTLYWKTHGTKQLLTKRFHRFCFLNQGNPPPPRGGRTTPRPAASPAVLSFDWLALNDRRGRVGQGGRRGGAGVGWFRSGGGRWRDGRCRLPVLDHSARPGLLVALAASMQVGAKKVLSHKAMHQYFKTWL